MIDFNSSLLKALPPPAKPDRTTGKMAKRFVIVAVLAAIIGIPAFVIVTRILPENGAGYLFYWLHDNVYLPVKGYAFTQYYPYSISWWGMASTVGFFWLLGYMTRTSVLKEAHIFWLRKIVRRTSQHRILVKSSHLLEKLKLKPKLLHHTAAMERKIARLQLTSTPINKKQKDSEKLTEKLASQLTHLTILNLNLQLHPPPKKKKKEKHKVKHKEKHLDITHNISPNLEAAHYTHQAYLHIRAHLHRHPQNKKLQQLTSTLANQIDIILSPILNIDDPEQLKEAAEKTGQFELLPTALDLLYLASLHNQDTADALAQNPVTGSNTIPGDPKQSAKNHLATSVYRRQTILETVIQQLESDVIDLEHILPPDQETHHHLPEISRLSLSIALDFSLQSANPAVALAYMETQEILNFTLSCLDPDSPFMEQIQPIYQLVQLPQPEHYRLCAELMETEIKSYELGWQQSILKDSETILPSDFQLSRTRIRQLNQAAGPLLQDSPKE